MNQKLRSILLVGALVATGGAVYWANQLPGDDAQVAAPAARERTARAGRDGEGQDGGRSPGAGALDLSRLQRPPIDDPTVSLFDARSFAPEPPKPTPAELKRQRELAAAPPPPPPPPPLPFTYMGQLSEGKEVLVFLTEGDRNLSVRKGEVIDDKYRVEDINQSELVLVYLPQNVKQTLPIGVAR